MVRRVLFMLSIFFPIEKPLVAQQNYNFDFETTDGKAGNVNDWDMSFLSGGAKGFTSTIDSSVYKNGRYSLRIQYDSTSSIHTFGACSFLIPVNFKGVKVQLRGFLKTERISDDAFAGLWMRIDGPNGVLTFNNMQRDKITRIKEMKF